MDAGLANEENHRLHHCGSFGYLMQTLIWLTKGGVVMISTMMTPTEDSNFASHTASLHSNIDRNYAFHILPIRAHQHAQAEGVSCLLGISGNERQMPTKEENVSKQTMTTHAFRKSNSSY